MSFASEMDAFMKKVERRQRQIFTGTAMAVRDSVVEGSPVTGAPGQPVDTGMLKGSWQLTFPTATEAMISTNLDYARHVEDNVRGVVFRVGGPHGVKQTRLNFSRLVDSVVKTVAG